MLVRCTIEFRDLKAPGKPMRRVGDEWETTPERLHELRCSRYGVLAEESPDRGHEAPPAAHSAAKRGETREAVEAPAERPTADELEGMTNRELVELCIKNDVETSGRPKKAELVSALKAFYGLE